MQDPHLATSSATGALHPGWISSAALLPLRIFVGFTFVFAGIDKIALDPSFLNLSSRSSILVQLQGYAHASPLAPLITDVAIPNAWLMGLLIAISEIAVGLGLLSGLAFRLAATGGAALSLLFFLTASWNVHPYYFGQDLPYGFAFLTLALAGHGDRYVLGPWLERQLTPRPATGRRGQPGVPMSPGRRQALQVGVLAIGALLVAAVMRPLHDLLLPASPAAAGAAPGQTSSSSAGAGLAGTSGSAAAGSTAGPAGGSINPLVIASAAAVAQAGAFGFQVPITIGNASPGDPGIVVSLGSDQFAAFDAVCTHAGCTVGFDPQSQMLVCPCHGATYDPRHNAQPVAGPTNIPLTALPISVQSGEITLRA